MGIIDRQIGSGPKSTPCSHLRSIETIDRPRPGLLAQADSSRSLSFAFGTALPAPLRPLAESCARHGGCVGALKACPRNPKAAGRIGFGRSDGELPTYWPPPTNDFYYGSAW